MSEAITTAGRAQGGAASPAFAGQRGSWYLSRMSDAGDDQATSGRDLMAPDTEPTDEELAVVMREALARAMERRALADAWIAARLEEATRFAEEHARPRAQRGPGRS